MHTLVPNGSPTVAYALAGCVKGETFENGQGGTVGIAAL